MKLYHLCASIAALSVGGITAGVSPAAADGSENCATYRDAYEICAGSVLAPSASYSYHTRNLFLPGVAWCEGAGGPLATEGFYIGVLNGMQVARIEIDNGYGRTAETYANNARARTISIEAPTGGVGNVALVGTWELKDTAATQTITFPAQDATELHVRFDEFYPGEKYEDFCISGFRLFAE